jgi:hypothetical protein
MRSSSFVVARTVVDPSGDEWRVGRVWFTRTARWRSPVRPRRILDVADGLDAADLLAEVPGIGAAVVLVVTGAALGMLAVFFVLPALALLVEALVVVLIAVGALVTRVFFRRPWIVVARRKETQDALVRSVVGLRASTRAVQQLAQQVERGEGVPRRPVDTA